ncbi:FecR family protein [Niastella caeni]|nr:FecR family protein [Niastella caeni]
MEEADYLAGLLLKQLRHEITEEELQYLENWKAGDPSHTQVAERINNGEQLLTDLLAMKQVDMEGWWQKISEQIETVKKPIPFYRRWYTYAAAAVVLLIAGAVTWQYLTPPKSPQVTEKHTPAVINILPGGNKATLTLSNGAVVNLASAANGTVAQEGNSKVVKLQDGELKYEPAIGTAKREQSAITAHNTLSTPRGGQYSLVLPDGSKAWLNAASSITYPTQFAAGERRVAITGEVYFDVAKQKIPFIVSVRSSTGNDLTKVEVLGTQFNIMAYDDEAALKTTLVSGKVKISTTNSFKLLTPGQQVQIPQSTAGVAGSNDIKVVDINDTEEMDVAIGWKNGSLTFNKADIRSIMRVLSRWYNIEVGYQGKIPDYRISGSFPRTENISSIIAVLEFEGYHFKQEQNKIIVTP